MKETESALQYFNRAFSEIISECASTLCELIQPFADFFINYCTESTESYELIKKHVVPKRVVHLAKYAKKKRMRKKNQHRIQKEYKKFFKNLRSAI